ncbi:GntR family transcriptional regulator [Actinoplanes sp. GCM10030250]|uniref:GntR family transcriptional regulator n=1 Tax=Actinoplanes sp. GCM10030250 TaxID=3273376 RepID=UPI00361BB2B3
MESELAATIGVSRTPVREALRRLHAEGLVDWAANRGATMPAWSDQDLEEIFELRALLETPLVNRTFRRYDDAAMARSMSHHRELIAAFEAGDRAWAGSVMRAHILAARSTLGAA